MAAILNQQSTYQTKGFTVNFFLDFKYIVIYINSWKKKALSLEIINVKIRIGISW
jgi:hypothetical protein